MTRLEIYITKFEEEGETYYQAMVMNSKHGCTVIDKSSMLASLFAIAKYINSFQTEVDNES